MAMTETPEPVWPARRQPPSGLQDHCYREARAIDEWIVAADLGQSTDPTAIAALHHRVIPQAEWSPIVHTGTYPASTAWVQKRIEYFDVRHLERLPLGMPYPAQVDHIRGLLQRPPLDKAIFIIDETGVGRPVGDIFNAGGLRPWRITITAGNEVTKHGGKSYHVPKGVLISSVDARLNTGELRFAAELREAGTLADELKDFRRKVSDAGRATWAARAGAHDDLVLAVAMATWFPSVRPVSDSRVLRI
ncbi:MAG TPA: hypothetical protein VNR39_12190 [Pseudolabrys sp.]|nr:hypothetical protein [Pseudolabrys sp.]